MKKVLKIGKNVGLVAVGFIIGGMFMADGDTSDYAKEEPTKVVAKESKESTEKVDKEENKKEEIIVTKEGPKEIQTIKVFDDSSVNASYFMTQGDVTKIIIENKLDKAIGVQDQTFGINGFSTTGTTDSISIAPHSKGIIQIDLAEISGMYGTPATISGEITVFDNESYDDITSIKFNNVAVQ
jgi:hypothetical protein